MALHPSLAGRSVAGDLNTRGGFNALVSVLCGALEVSSTEEEIALAIMDRWLLDRPAQDAMTAEELALANDLAIRQSVMAPDFARAEAARDFR